MAININVKSSGGTKYQLDISSLEETIGAFKVRLAEVSDIPATSQRLIFRGHVLKDAQTFQQIRDKHGLESGQTMHVVRGATPSGGGGGGGGAGTGTRSTTAGTQTAPTPGAGTGPGTGATGTGAGTQPGAATGAGIGAGGFPGLGGMGGMGGFMQNPEQMRAVLDSPLMASIMQNPEIARSMMMANPQLRAVIERNPEVGHVFNDPATFRQMMELARNPSLMQEMMRNTDRQMANLEMMPGGFDALRRMQQDIQAPLMDAVQNMGTDPTTAAGTGAGTGAATGNGAGDNPFATLFQNTPSNAPMPNPWAPNNTTTPAANGGGARAAPGTSTGTQPPTGTAPPPPGVGGLPDMGTLFGAAGPGGLPNIPPEQMTAMMDNPMMRQLMESMAADPAMLEAMINTNPQLRAMADANPQVAQMLRNPELMRTMLSPEVMRSMMQLRSAMGGAGPGIGLGGAFGAGTTPSTDGTATATPPTGTGTAPPTTGTAPPAAGTGTGTPDIAGLMAMMNAMGMGGGAQAPAPQPALTNEQLEEMYASQLQQLRDMGFLDTPMCVQALRRANGNVAAAVEILLNQLGG